MTKSKKALQLALGGVVAAGLAAAATDASASSKPEWEGHEKCYGVSAKGQNDCGNAHHNCGGKAKADRDPEEWIYLPKGTCEKIAGGSLEATRK